MENPDIVEHFFGVYLLFCKNPKYKGRVYVGYTVNPIRRIGQHNAGQQFGGARRTSNKGPWTMVLVVHGFPNATSALRFEWAWQHPTASRRLKHLSKKAPRQSIFEYHLLLLTEMLNLGPWCRLPLTLRWLDHEFWKNHSSKVSPPLHMPISHGKVVSKSLNNKKKNKKTREEPEEPEDPFLMVCSLCDKHVDTKERVTCVKHNCHLLAHLSCLAKNFTSNNSMILPIAGNCPACKTNVLWGDLIRKKLGCNLHLDEVDPKSDDSNDHQADSLSD